jgi:lantibiotic leader peptide-processing serine protease
MKRNNLLSAVLVSVVIAACADDPAQPRVKPQFSEATEIGGTYLVRFKKDIPATFASDVAALGGEVIFAHAGAGIAAVAGLIPSSASALAAKPGIDAVDADAYVEVPAVTIDGLESAEGIESPANPAGAVRYPRQWHMQTIQASLAWAAGKRGAAAVKVGVLDTGIDYLAPDLVGRVDLALSRSFLSTTENNRVQTAWPGAHPVADLHYHGTHVAATIASNAYIAAGVTSEVTLVGLKVCAPGTAPSFRGTCPTSGTMAAILYAADNGIPIINMSLGGAFQRRDASAQGGAGPSFIATINSVFNYANKKGTVVVVSAGNSAIDMDNDINGYKTYCDAPHVVCVSATGPTSVGPISGTTGQYQNIQNIDALASYSNFGGKVTVAAPGGAAAPVWEACSGFTIVTSLLACRNRFFNNPASWSGFIVGVSGTSMAAPHTAGVLALIASHVTSGGPQIKSVLTGTTDDLGAVGYDPIYGNGRINARKAMGL